MTRRDVQWSIGSGNTPLVRINSLSDALGVEILGKAEVGFRHVFIESSDRVSLVWVVSESRRECQGSGCIAK